jgi:hypothetical protein
MSNTITVTMNAAPVVVMDNAASDTICHGDNTLIDLTFIGNGPYSFTVSDGTNTYDGTSAADDPYIPAGVMIPVWNIADGISSNYTYTITIVTDSNGCTNTGDNTVNVVVFKVPETGPQYHVPNTWSN